MTKQLWSSVKLPHSCFCSCLLVTPENATSTATVIFTTTLLSVYSLSRLRKTPKKAQPLLLSILYKSP